MNEECPPKVENREWTWMDRTQWDAGLVAGEPDKAQWQDEATGLPCLIHRGPGGAWCGYVGVRPDHPWHGLDYSDCSLPTSRPRGPQPGDETFTLNDSSTHRRSQASIDRMRGQRLCDEIGRCDHRPDMMISVHGGLTYADHCRPHPDNPEHGICHVVNGEDNVWWFGFDCNHAWDVAPGRPELCSDGFYRDRQYVEHECTRLAEQLKAVQDGTFQKLET